MISGEYKGFWYAFGAYVVPDASRIPSGFLAINPRCVNGEKHLLSSLMTAVDAYLARSSVAKDLGMEFLVRLTGNRQISKAMECLDPKPGKVVLIWLSGREPPKLQFKEVDLPQAPMSEELDAIERRLLLV